VAYLVEILLFLLPFAAYGLWRRMNPNTQPSTILLVLAGLGVVLMLAGAFWYGASRSMRPGTTYVPAHLEGDRIEPGHAEPRR
jgi:cytochrome c-type biogenesis protein CcmH/NrfF